MNKDLLDKHLADVGFGDGHNYYRHRASHWSNYILLAPVQHAEPVKSKNQGSRWITKLNQLAKTRHIRQTSPPFIPRTLLANFQPCYKADTHSKQPRCF